MIPFIFKTNSAWALAVAGSLALAGSPSQAQSGNFVIPSIRSGGGTEFAYWNWFQAPPGTAYNYLYNNPPALLNGGKDANGNATNLTGISLVQTGTPTCFITSSGALYSFAAPTAFEVEYSHGAAESPTTNVIIQIQTGGRRFDLDDIRLHYTPDGGAEVALAPHFKALDDPQTGAFSERLISAFQWNLTGLGVADFTIKIDAVGDSMPLWEAQLDVVKGSPFVRQLGYLLIPKSLPLTRFGSAGRIVKDLPVGVEDRFHNPGDKLPLLGNAENGWAHVGWLTEAGAVAGDSLTVTFENADLTATALFAPETYAGWRDKMFFHSNSLTGSPADNVDESFSGKEADPDGDGVNNFAEFAFGGDPYAADSDRTTPSCILVNVAGQLYPAVQYRQGTDGFTEVYYLTKWSPNLQDWQDNDSAEAPVTELHGQELQMDGSTLITVRSLQPISAHSKQFFVVSAE